MKKVSDFPGLTLRLALLISYQLFMTPNQRIVSGEECRLTPVFHVLQSPGCSPMTIPSFACIGKCTSYVQVSASKMWQIERSCMCCQESGEREATVTLSCPKAQYGSKIQKVVTKAPVDCMCRPCTSVDEGTILPQEMAGYLEGGGGGGSGSEFLGSSSNPGTFSMIPLRIQL